MVQKYSYPNAEVKDYASMKTPENHSGTTCPFLSNKTMVLSVLFFFIFGSCDHLENVNINPNAADPADTHPNLLMSTIVTETGELVVSLGFGDIAGVMQHTQKDGWSGTHNSYDWDDQSWSGYYGILRNVYEFYDKAVDLGLEFHQAAGLVMKAYVFGLITDIWGDAPYSDALTGDEGNLQPVFDTQEEIYNGILADLETANTLLSKDDDEYEDISSTQDELFGGNVTQWRKLANSIALRYYMRLSEKNAELAQAGIEKIAGDPDQYPLILDAADDACITYYGNNSTDSWPTNTTYDSSSGSNYRRLKMCSTLVEELQALNDPRLAVWANKIEIPIVIDESLADDYDEIIDGVRHIAQNIAGEYEAAYGYQVDTDPEYVGMPPAWSAVPQAYNLSPDLSQAPYNPHVSHINSIYTEPSGSILKARLISAAEVNFILAEAALNGWAAGGNAEDYYRTAIEASFEAWEVEGQFDDYMNESGVVFNETQEQIITQKWIASWTSAAEAWFDYRRTGYPALEAGPVAKRDALPLRFYYPLEEIDYNPANTEVAIGNLETTTYSETDGKNSAWSKMWLLQGTGKPW